MWRQQELYQQISKFEQQIETYEQVNRQLNEAIGNLKQQLKF
jgi:cell division protein FtsB